MVIGGFDWWRGYDRDRIVEPCFEEKVVQVLGCCVLRESGADISRPGSRNT